MDNQSLLSLLKDRLENVEGTIGNQYVELTIEPSVLHQNMLKIKNENQLKFDFLACETGFDFNQKIGVVYHLRSTELNHSIVVKCFANSHAQPELPTVSDIWVAAQYYEREIFDLLGINFINHPNMIRLFLEDDFVGHPLRKDFSDSINIIAK